MEVLLLTGMSGAGKSQVGKYLEDMGYFCIDNLPPNLISPLVRGFQQAKADSVQCPERIALGIDVRSAEFFDDWPKALEALEDLGIPYRLLFMDASDPILLSRYKQTRRNHPLAKKGMGIPEAIRMERDKLQDLRRQADDLIDTTNFSLSDLRDYIYKLLSKADQPEQRMSIRIVSFGFKYGLPLDADVVQDVRFIPNPYYDPLLRPQTGLDQPVQEAVFSHEQTKRYLDQLEALLRLLIPHYISEGKVRLTIAVGCTGGRHRSVAIAEEIAHRLLPLGLSMDVYHRDLRRDPGHITKREAYETLDQVKPHVD